MGNHESVEAQVNKNLQQWFDETAYLSYFDLEHSACKAVVSLGEVAVPYLFKHLEEQTDWSFLVIRQILNDGPVIPPEAAGRLEILVKLWLDWGREQNLR